VLYDISINASAWAVKILFLSLPFVVGRMVYKRHRLSGDLEEWASDLRISIERASALRDYMNKKALWLACMCGAAISIWAAFILKNWHTVGRAMIDPR